MVNSEFPVPHSPIHYSQFTTHYSSTPMPKKTKQPTPPKQIVALKHDEASRKNIPTAELESVMQPDQQSPIRVAYERRNKDLDPQLVWRGKDEQDWSDLIVQAPP